MNIVWHTNCETIFAIYQLQNVITDYLDCCKKAGAWPNFSLGNHDTPRGTSRFGLKLAAFGMNVLLLLLPGTPLTYYGEEIGMLDNAGHMECMSESRDPCRSHMQWNESKNAGIFYVVSERLENLF